MANWAKRNPVETTTRRKWKLEDRSSLNNLKYHFAADGCSDVQYDLGKQLLQNTSGRDERMSQAQGVHWLLRAAQQGHEKALDMLRECYETRRGITEGNELDVKMSLSMTAEERAARKAARELFVCLSLGGDHITPSQLEQKMREIYNIQKRKRSSSELSAKSSEQIRDNDRMHPPSDLSHASMDVLEKGVITEANLITAAINYSRGQLPTVSQVLTLSVPHPNSLNHVPRFHRMIFHPIVFFSLLYHSFIRAFASFPRATSFNTRLFLLFLTYVFISSENSGLFLPLCAYFSSFAVMVCSTFRMLKTKHEFVDFRIWSGLFLSYGDNIDAARTENQFLRNNMKPYLYFFLAFIVNLVSYPAISRDWMPYSEITVLSFLFVFLTMVAFMYTSPRGFPDLVILFSFAVNVLAKYPYEMDSVVTTGWRFLDLKIPTFSSFIIGNGIEFCLNCRAVLYLSITGFFIQLAKRSNWHGVYIYLLPHCVTLSWLQVCIVSSQYATMFGLVRAALGLAGILLFLPLFGIITLMIPIFAAVEWLGLTDTKVRIVTTLLAACFAMLVSCLVATNKRTHKYVTFVQVGVCMIAAALLILPYMSSGVSMFHLGSSVNDAVLGRKVVLDTPKDNSAENTLSWDLFYKHCNHPTSEHVNKIRTQLKCSLLENFLVKWEGTVSAIQIAKVSNFRATLIRNYLPSWLGNIITCYFGNEDNFMCDESDQCDELRKVPGGKSCNLHKWNTYEYEIRVSMHSGILSRPSEVYLKASHQFGNFTKNLVVSDRVWFKGRLLNSRRTSDQRSYDMILGAERPLVDLLAIGCVACQDNELASKELIDKEKFVESARIKDLMRGVKYFLNVLFNPLITFK